MASPPAPLPAANPAPPEADPLAIRACMSPRLVAEFDAEWDIVLEQAKASKDLAGVHKLLQKWRHLAYSELRDPGAHSRLLAKTEQIVRTGENPTASSFEDMQALIRERLGRQVSYRIVPDHAVVEQVAALPTEALAAYAEVLDVLLTPWNGDSQHEDNPDAQVRRWQFGPELAGQVVYLIIDDRLTCAPGAAGPAGGCRCVRSRHAWRPWGADERRVRPPHRRRVDRPADGAAVPAPADADPDTGSDRRWISGPIFERPLPRPTPSRRTPAEEPVDEPPV